jgi:hypothetical protein
LLLKKKGEKIGAVDERTNAHPPLDTLTLGGANMPDAIISVNAANFQQRNSVFYSLNRNFLPSSCARVSFGLKKAELAGMK